MTYPEDIHQREVQRVVNYVLVKRLMNLAADPKSSPQTKAICFAKLEEIKSSVGEVKSDPEQEVHFQFLNLTIEKFLKDPEKFKLPEAVKIPNGAPIGG